MVKTVLKSLNEETMSRVYLVFNRYFDVSLKGETRDRQGSSFKVSVKENTPIVRDWGTFLKERSKRDQLFKLLAEKTTAVRSDGKTVVSTKGENVVSSVPVNTTDLSPFNALY